MTCNLQLSLCIYICSAGFIFPGTNNIGSLCLAKEVLLQLPVGAVY